jgi:hypothetical protein
METAFSASRPTSPSEPLAAPAQEFIGSLQPDSWLLAALEEYKSLRMESLDSMKVQNSILGYGVAGIGALLTAGISLIDKNDNPVLEEAIFCFFIPLVVFFIVMTWAGEVARMYRAGKFLVDREPIINQHAAGMGSRLSACEPALSWENWLSRTGKNNETPHQKLYLQHYSILGTFLFIALLSVTMGNYKASGHSPLELLIIIDLVAVCALAYLTYVALSLLRHFHPPIAGRILPMRVWIVPRLSRCRVYVTRVCARTAGRCRPLTSTRR